jgi:hypothetical protein
MFGSAVGLTFRRENPSATAQNGSDLTVGSARPTTHEAAPEVVKPEVLLDFAKQNSRALQVKQAIKLANTTTMKDDNDKLLLHFAKDNASTLTAGDAFELAKNTWAAPSR